VLRGSVLREDDFPALFLRILCRGDLLILDRLGDGDSDEPEVDEGSDGVEAEAFGRHFLELRNLTDLREMTLSLVDG